VPSAQRRRPQPRLYGLPEHVSACVRVACLWRAGGPHDAPPCTPLHPRWQRGEGETALTNKAIQIRRRYRKIYEDFKPQFVYWKPVLLVRKLLFAFVVVLVNSNVEAQVGLWLGGCGCLCCACGGLRAPRSCGAELQACAGFLGGSLTWRAGRAVRCAASGSVRPAAAIFPVCCHGVHFGGAEAVA
jgi:hypothetical protein